MEGLFTLLFTNRFRFSASGYSNRLHRKLLVRKILITDGKRTAVEIDVEFTKFASFRIYASAISFFFLHVSMWYQRKAFDKEFCRSRHENIWASVWHHRLFGFFARLLFEVSNFNSSDCRCDRRSLTQTASWFIQWYALRDQINYNLQLKYLTRRKVKKFIFMKDWKEAPAGWKQ